MSMDSLLKKATTNDDNPTPGYVYTELAKLTHADITVCDKMADWLFDKLKKNDSAIKWKTLLVMKHVAKGGRMDFRRSLQKRNDEVKAALQFKGPPDPLRGDEPYRRVRDAAKEALEAMFDNTPPPSVSSSAMNGRITGMSSGSNDPRFPPASSSSGSNSGYPPIPQVRPSGGVSGGFSTALPGQPGYDPNSPLHAPPVSTGSMSGFGNYDPKKDSGGGILGAVKSAFTTSVTSVPPPTARPQGPPSNNGYPPVSQNRSNYPPSESSSSSNAGGYGGPSQFGASSGNHRPGQPGGGWGPTSTNFPPSNGPNPSQGLGRRGHMPPGSSGEPGRVGGAAKDGKFERTLVEDLTAPGGVRAVPDKDKLTSFITSVRTLDMTVIGPLLDERLSLAFPESTDASGVAIATKALLVIEAIANSSVEGIEPVRKYLADHCDVLLDLLENTEVKSNVRSITHRTLRALGVQVDEPAGLAPAPAPTQVFTYASPEPAPAPVPVVTNNTQASIASKPNNAAPDLLGLDFLSTPAPAPQPSANLFAGLSATTTTSPSFVAPTPVPAPAPAVSGFTDLFGGLSLGGPSVSATTAPVTTVASSFPQVTNPTLVPTQPMIQPQPSQPQPQQQLPQPTMNAAVPNASAALQQQLMAIQQQISMITMQISSNPAAASALMPQVMALQQQQTQLIMASTQQQAMQGQQQQQPMGGFGGMQQQQPMGGFGGMQQQQPMGGFGGMQQPMVGFGGMSQQQQQPMVGFGGLPQAQGFNMMNPTGTLGGMGNVGPKPTAPNVAPGPAPAPAPRPTDAFDFASAGLFG